MRCVRCWPAEFAEWNSSRLLVAPDPDYAAQSKDENEARCAKKEDDDFGNRTQKYAREREISR